MSDPQLLRLQGHLGKLTLFTVQARIETLLQEASAQEVTYTDFLDRLLTEEVTAKGEKYVAMCTAMALGLKAVQQNYRTLLTAAHTLAALAPPDRTGR
jgi:hypothetical protein